jgi:hypothetical protein
MTLQAYLGDESLKAFVLDQLAKHREADKLVKGQYWDKGKGCAVGCTLEAVRLRSGAETIKHNSHMLYQKYLGIPVILARLEDGFFENLPNGKAQAWPERFASVIRVGADLESVWPKFAQWLLTDEANGVKRLAKTDLSRAAIQGVSDAYARGEADRAEWQRLRSTADAAAYAAYDAAADAAYDAAAAAAYAAYNAAAANAAAAAAAADAAYDAAAAAAADAAYDAAYDAAADARQEHYIGMSDKLIELLEAA